MKSQIVIKNISKNGSHIKIDYTVSDNLKEFFNLDNKFEVDYYENVESIPDCVAVIPFVSNVLPIIWLSDSELVVESLDYDYSKSINKTRTNFNKMYKTDIFKGNVVVKNEIKHKKSRKKENVSVFCSGGVDSTLSIVKCLEKGYKPLLITVWGTDVWDNNNDGWKSLKNYSSKLSKKLKLKNLYIKTNFRKFIYEHVLTEKLLRGRINDSWWRGIQHGIGLLGHVAPLAYMHNIKIHYIPATLNKKNLGATCGSFPTIDESVRFLDCKINHSGYEYTRVEKVKKITEYFKNHEVDLRVCYMDKGDKLNCCHCEKCYLTIMELISIGEDPKNWGFDITDEEISKIPLYLKEKASDSPINIEIWDDIIKQSYKNIDFIKSNNNYKWILKYRNQRNLISYLIWKAKIR